MRGVEQHVLGALELGDVDRHADGPDDVAPRVRQRLDVMAQPAIGAQAFEARRLAREHVTQNARVKKRLG